MTSRYTVINRGTIPNKIDHVLTVTVLPRCSPGLVPSSPRWHPVHPNGIPVTDGHDTVVPRCLSVLKIIVTGVSREATSLTWWCPGSPEWSSGEALICAGIARCRPSYPRFAQDYPRLSWSSPSAIMVCHSVAPVFDISHGSPWLSNRGEPGS